jgi:hypothetical protein
MPVVNAPSAATVGFAPEEVDFSLSTRQARLKWVVIVNADLPAPEIPRTPGPSLARPGV